MERPLDVIDTADAAAKIPDLKIVGDPDGWVLISKASSKIAGFSHSTKAMWIEGDNPGTLVLVTSVHKGSISNALAFLPGTRIRDLPE